MFQVLKLQLLRLRREPILFLSFFLMTVIFVFTMVGTNNDTTRVISTFSTSLSESELLNKVELLNKEGQYIFEVQDKAVIESKIQSSELSFAINLGEDNYQFLVGQDSQLQAAVNQHVESVYRTQLTLNQVNDTLHDSVVVQKEIINATLIPLNERITDTQSSSANILVGMTLYFSVFTILINITNVTQEKISGTWNRMVLSPLRKTQIYSGLLAHYFIIGMVQILACFAIFKLFFHYDFGSQYGSILIAISAFVFATVSLGIMLVSIVKSPQQLQAIIPVFTTASAMLGGAFWPLDIVTNGILLNLAKITPIYYGMEALKGAILFNQGPNQILFPVSILLLMGVVFMGVGLNIMEKNK